MTPWSSIFDYKALQTDTDSGVLTIGGGSDDAATLAELLDSTDQSNNVFHINYEFDASAKVQVLNVFTDATRWPNTTPSRPSTNPVG